MRFLTVTLFIIGFACLLLFVFDHKQYHGFMAINTTRFISMWTYDERKLTNNDSRSTSIITRTCTSEQADRQGTRYTTLIEQSRFWSACYSGEFLRIFYLVNRQTFRQQTMLFIDVGANKGYTLATWLSIWLPSCRVSPDRLREYLRENLHLNDCGICNDCEHVPFDTWPSISTMNITVDIHAFEPQPSTYDILNQVRQWTNVSSLYTYNLALSNQTGIGLFRQCKAGIEVCGLASPTHPKSSPNWKYIQVNMTTLDEFIESHNITHRIDLLKIDAEGFDPLVLQGATRLLSQHRIRIFLFEYHGIGAWKRTSLYQTVDDLNRKDYTCYQIGRTGLFRLTDCWSSKFEIKRWGNIICVTQHEQTLIQAIEQLVIEI
jgi:FkbM family methyltransferase